MTTRRRMFMPNTKAMKPSSKLTMIKLTKATPLPDFLIKLVFSDNSCGILDFKPILQRTGSLLEPLRDPIYFNRCFIEMGALCWPNGLELGAESLKIKLADDHAIHESDREAA